MSSKAALIAKKIKQLTGQYENDVIGYVVGTVTFINPNDPSDPDYDPALVNTCQCVLITDKTISGTVSIPENDMNGNPITNTQQDSINDFYAQGLTLTNVALSVNGSNKNTYTVPEIGSEVIIFNSTYQQPFIAQYSDIRYNQTTFNSAISYSGQTSDGQNGFAWQIIDEDHFFEFVPTTGNTSSSTFQLTSDNINLSNMDGSTLFQINDNGVGFKVNDSSVFITNSGQIQIQSSADILIKGTNGHISIKNDSSNLKDLLTAVKTCLNDMALATIPTTPPTTLSTLNPDIIAQISTITTQISGLLA